MRDLHYSVFLKREPEGTYTAIVPILPGCISWGDTIDTAIDNAHEAIELYLESLLAHGEEIPTEEGILESHIKITSYDPVATS
ncbi:MAG: type II toxin-antitoxin system HicB family antitoxin [Methanospirillaceae archaeon]|nr:type II toxin-antitoxin system HicB family antitoxin [Methanospirillaceae archaeon]